MYGNKVKLRIFFILLRLIDLLSIKTAGRSKKETLDWLLFECIKPIKANCGCPLRAAVKEIFWVDHPSEVYLKECYNCSDEP